MLTRATLEGLRELRLDGMAEACAELESSGAGDGLSREEWLGLLVDRERSSRETKRYRRRLLAAKLRHGGARGEDVDYGVRRGLERGQFRELLGGRWIAEGRNLLLTGPCGVGKTWLACAVGEAACRRGETVMYRRLPRLLGELELSHGDGSYPRVFRALGRVRLLILDDWGPERLSESQRRDLMEVVEERSGRGSVAITSQLPVSEWHQVIGEATLADAILDRLVHSSYRIELDGPSLRARRAEASAGQGQAEGEGQNI